MKRYVFSLPIRYGCKNIGSKAQNIIFLSNNHFLVPCFYLCVWDAYVDYKSGNNEIPSIVQAELKDLIADNKKYIVRSSANIEDESAFSFAGQFISVPDLQGIDQIINAIIEVWNSVDSPCVKSYLAENDLIDKHIKMGVIIQEMIPAVFSGISFSKNPITGMSEIIVEAGSGQGDLLMQKGHEPFRWVSKWGNIILKPEDSQIPEILIYEIVKKTSEIATSYKKAVDIEWIYDGKKLWFVQVRPITTIDITIFSNRISKEMLPGIIKPLVYNINTSLINGIWVKILSNLTGEKSIHPENLTGHFYYRAYFNMSAFGKIFEKFGMPYEALELLMGIEADGPSKPRMKPGIRSFILIPRLVLFLLNLMGLEKRFKHQTGKKLILLRKLSDQIAAESDPKILISLKNKLSVYMEIVAYFNILIPLLAIIYTKILSSMLKKEGIDYRDLDMTGVSRMTQDFSPHGVLNRLHEKYYMNNEMIQDYNREEFEEDKKNFLENFGHFSDSGNDFSSIPWRESPELISSMIRNSSNEKKIRTDKILFENLKFPFLKKFIIGHIYKNSLRFASLREEISSLYTYGYGLFRPLFFRISDVLLKNAIIDKKEDIFYLTIDELQKIIFEENYIDVRKIIFDRRSSIKDCIDINLPENIFGNKQPPVDKSNGTSLTGTATSPGTYTGPTKVLKGFSDFEKLNPGDVLVIPYSDAGWTPLFSKAGAVIAESGGMLSHSSIVAREYGIPAVVSVKDACMIPDFTIVNVNGFTGKITFEEEL